MSRGPTSWYQYDTIKFASKTKLLAKCAPKYLKVLWCGPACNIKSPTLAVAVCEIPFGLVAKAAMGSSWSQDFASCAPDHQQLLTLHSEIFQTGACILVVVWCFKVVWYTDAGTQFEYKRLDIRWYFERISKYHCAMMQVPRPD